MRKRYFVKINKNNSGLEILDRFQNKAMKLGEARNIQRAINVLFPSVEVKVYSKVSFSQTKDLTYKKKNAA